MPATSATSRSASPTRSRLPLTPKVVANRRGGHAATRPVRTSTESTSVAASPAMHVTPNVVSAARGRVTPVRSTRLADAFDARALDMRGLRL